MKRVLVLFLMIFSFKQFAHEGHGEAPKDPSRFGGQLSNIVDSKKLTTKNNPSLFKSELIRSEDGTVRFYIFDLKMKDLDLATFSQKIEAKIENHKNKININFELTKEGDHYTGKMPKINKRPFNLFFKLQKEKQELFAGYDNLD